MKIPDNAIFALDSDTIYIANPHTLRIFSKIVSPSDKDQFFEDLDLKNTISQFSSLGEEIGFGIIGNISINPTTAYMLNQLLDKVSFSVKVDTINSLLNTSFPKMAEFKKYASKPTVVLNAIPSIVSSSNTIKAGVGILTFITLSLAATNGLLDLMDRTSAPIPDIDSDIVNILGSPEMQNNQDRTNSLNEKSSIISTDKIQRTDSCEGSDCYSSSLVSAMSIDPDPDRKGGGIDPIVFGQWWYDTNDEEKCRGDSKFDYDSDGWFEDFCYVIRNNSTDPNSGIFLVDIPYSILEEKFNVENTDKVKYPSGWNMLAINDFTITYILRQIPNLCEDYKCYIWNDEFNKNWKVEDEELNPFTDSFDTDKIKMLYPAKKVIDGIGNERYIYCKGETVNGIEFVCLKPTYWMKGIS